MVPKPITRLKRADLSVIQFADFAIFAHLFAMLPRLGDSEVTFSVFESSCQYSILKKLIFAKDK